MRFVNISWRSYHKWGGLLATVFVLIFCLSGIILNHRAAFAGINVSRVILPSAYRINHYNNGSIKGSLALAGDSLLAFGNVGIWLTDGKWATFRDFNIGMPDGIDHLNIKNVVMDRNGVLWCAGQFDVYRHDGQMWRRIELPGNSDRLSDLTLNADSSRVIVLTRSNIYGISTTGDYSVSGPVSLQSPDGVVRQVSLFKTVWMLHSGELFGLTGRIAVDIVAVVIIFLCVTGLVIFILPYGVRHRVKYCRGGEPGYSIRILKWNIRWHNKIGYITALFTIILAATGMCLRPPLMIPLVLGHTAPMPGSVLDSDNYWNDKLRGIRWDAASGCWLLSTSDGFIKADENFGSAPVQVSASDAPPVSPMGVTVFEPDGDGRWLIGSFSGLYRWDMSTGAVTDYFTGAPYDRHAHGFGTGSHLVSGLSRDVEGRDDVVFDYASGADGLPEMVPEFACQPMSLWNVALELHVGRCYTPFMGPFSQLFVFVFGLVLVLLLVSGLIIMKRNNKHNKSKITKQ